MIIYRCDGCKHEEEHDGPDIPDGWASITAMVRWQAGKAGTDQECNARLLCKKCRRPSQGILCVVVEKILSDGLDKTKDT